MLNSPKRFFFFSVLNRLTARQKKNCNFIIADKEKKLNTDDLAVSNLLNGKFVSMSKTFAASVPTVPCSTEGLAISEMSICFHSTDSLEVSKIVRNLENHKAARLDGLTAESSKFSLDDISDRRTYRINDSLSSGFFPKILKTAKVIPVFMSGKQAIVRIKDPYQFYRF